VLHRQVVNPGSLTSPQAFKAVADSMGSVAVATMADEPPSISLKKLHPFFVPPRSARAGASLDTASATTEPVEAALDDETESDCVPAVEMQTQERGRKRKQPDAETGEVEKRRPGRPRNKERPSSGSMITTHFARLHQDSPPSPPTTSEGNEPAAHNDGGDEGLLPAPASSAAPNANKTNGKPGAETTPTEKPPPSPTPKKLLKFNLKTGTLGSPPKPKEAAQELRESAKSPRPSRKKGPGPGLLVTVRYGNDDDSRVRIGGGINKILNNASPSPNNRRSSRSRPLSRTGKRSAANASPARSTATKTHPLFLSKAQPTTMTMGDKLSKPTSKPASNSLKQFTSTPCSPKKPRLAPSAFHIPQFGAKNSGLRIPGAKLAAWPWKDMVHVRGQSPSGPLRDAPLAHLSRRKAKGHTVHVDADESILVRQTRQLDVPEVLASVRAVDTDNFLPPPPELRLPQRHFESGYKLQQRVASELKSSDSSLKRLFNSVETSLSAFDRSQCETQGWAQKYAPACAAEVLQPGREPFLLREWLKGLKVQSVDTGASDPISSNSTKKSLKSSAEKKKKRKRSKLEGFVVSSDEEADEMDAISEEDADWAPGGRYGLAKKTVVRAGDAAALGSKDGGRLTNAVVISGPHGCGKTAAVYAVAKELDFEVFEINSSSRRAGKDVLEKIGDMTKNHLVQQQSGTTPVDGSSAIITEEVAMEINSGRQATMGSFFKAKGRPKKAPSSGTTHSLAKEERSATNKPATVSQKQSLILLEEVDVLYEEDKTFWATVLGLISQSKRPFIMTCTDEALVPLRTLTLHGIYRFSPPVLDTAVDRLLLIAANEGHALRRGAVEALYDCCGQDFRASLMDLSFWCQIGVGDRRGGADWFYLRWPKGVDLDEEGRVVRVVSEDTYREGMGWICQDTLAECRTHGGAEDDLIQQTWTNWGLDAARWHEPLAKIGWTSGAERGLQSRRLRALEAYDHFADTISMADITSSGAFAEDNKVCGPRSDRA